MVGPTGDLGSKRREYGRNHTQGKPDPAEKTAVFGAVWMKVDSKGAVNVAGFDFSAKRNIKIYGEGSVVRD